jgi:hypothetical protein
MADGMFGAPTGFSARQADDQSAQLHEVAMIEHGLDIRQKQQALQQQEQIQQRVAQMGQGGGQGGAPSGDGQAQDPVEQFVKRGIGIAQIYSDVGQHEKAMAMFATVEKANESYQLSKSHKLDADIKSFTELSTFLDGVHDQGTLQDAIPQIQASGIKVPPKLMGMLQQAAMQGWNPQTEGFVAKLKNGVLNGLQRSEMMKHEVETQSALITQDMTRAHTRLYDAEARNADARTDNVGKAGEKPPDADTVGLLKDRIAARYDDDPHKIDRLARTIAERAVVMRRDNHLSYSEAARAAYLEAYSQGKFTGMTLRTTTEGSSAKAPLPLPKDPYNEKSYTEGQYYNIPIMKNGKQVGTRKLIRTDKPLNDPDAFVEPPDEEE